jgi:Transposase DDE domain
VGKGRKTTKNGRTVNSILPYAQVILYTLLELMPSPYQQLSLQASLAMFFEPSTVAKLPEYGVIKSPSALSRFLNEYGWPTLAVIRATRQEIRKQLMRYAFKGRRPQLQVIIDLTTLEKRGKFKAFANLIQVLNGKRGLHLVVMYLVVGELRMPWAFRPWRGKDTTTPAQLGLKLLRTLPKQLCRRFRVQVLADTGFSSVEFLESVRKQGFHAIVGMPKNRLLTDGRPLKTITKKGQLLQLDDLSFQVYAAWFYLHRDGKLEKRFVISTRRLKGNTITWWGRRRWAIEGFFKTAKYQFWLANFGQQTLLGVYRWLILSLISFVLVHWVYLSTASSQPPVWRNASELALSLLLPQISVSLLLYEVERKRELLASLGLRLELVTLSG